jgi:thioredoxin-related protein
MGAASVRRFLAACCIGGMLATGALASAPEAIPKTSFLDLKADAREAALEGKTLMLLFEQEGCSYCTELRRVNFAEPETAEMLHRRFDVVALDIWGSREVIDFAGAVMPEKQYARAFKVHFTPMVVFVAPDGKELFRMTGYYKPPEFRTALRYVAERHYERETFREYLHRAAEPTAPRAAESFFVAADDLQQALARSAAGGKGLALLFEQPRCPACDEMRSRSFTDPETVKMLTGAFDVAALDIWGRRALRQIDGSAITESDLAQRLDIRYTPTLVFLDARGTEVFRADNYRKPEHLAVVLRFLADRGYERYASFQHWLRATRATRR